VVGLIVCAQRVLHWQSVGDEALEEMTGHVHNSEEWNNYQRLVVQRANANIALWMTAALVWSGIFLVLIVLVHRWEGRELEEHAPSMEAMENW
jgi:hypothetical protein